MKSATSYVNPFLVFKRRNHEGKITAYLGLARATPPFIHKRKEVIEYLRELPAFDVGGTFVSAVGFHERGEEPSAQIVFINRGKYAKPNFEKFRAALLKTIRRLARRFGQRVVLIEEIHPNGDYRISDYVNYRAFRTKAEVAQEKIRMREMVRKGIIDAVLPGL